MIPAGSPEAKVAHFEQGCWLGQATFWVTSPPIAASNSAGLP